MIPGSAGSIEARYHSVPLKPQSPIVILVPPHPEQEGTMDHGVMYAMFRAFAAAGFNVLRFNFRGTGRSHGTFTNGEKEVADAAACLDWLQNKHPMASHCWVSGFSFGAYVALQLLMRRPECHHFAIVSPLTNLYDFSFLSPCPTAGVIFHGEEDEITPKESLVRFAYQISTQKKSYKVELKGLPQCDHSFTNQLPTLENNLREYVTNAIHVDGTSLAHTA